MDELSRKKRTAIESTAKLWRQINEIELPTKEPRGNKLPD